MTYLLIINQILSGYSVVRNVDLDKVVVLEKVRKVKNAILFVVA